MGSSSCGNCKDCADRHPILGKVFRVFRNDASSTGRTIEKEESYDSEKAMLEQTIRVQESLTAFRTRCEKECDALERDVLKDARNYIDDLIEFIKQINSQNYAGQKLNINIERLERENRYTEDIIRGYIKKKIQKRVSLDDNECLEILKMDRGSEKGAAMTKFLNTILRDAMKGLSHEIEKCLKKQLENIKDQINVRIESYTERSNEKMEIFQEMEKIKASDESKLEGRIADMEYKYSLCNVGICLLSEEVGQ